MNLHRFIRTSGSPLKFRVLIAGSAALLLGTLGGGCSDAPVANTSEQCPVACGPGQTCVNAVCTCAPGQNCSPAGAGGTNPVGVGGTNPVGSGGSMTGSGGAAGGAVGMGGVMVGAGGSMGGVAGSVAGMGGIAGAGGTMMEECTNVRPVGTDWDEASCALWAEQSEACSEQWFLDAGYCRESCGFCSNGNTGGSGGSGGTLGEDNPYGPVTNPEGETHATRYWDCCKPTCGWRQNTSNPVASCDRGGQNIGVTDEGSVCDGGNAQTCHGMAPWAHSNQVSYGFVAANGRNCGSCYHIQFTGQGHYNPDDVGSQAIAGKVMIVKVTNTGGELGDGHFDLLIPGGGLGQRQNGCESATGISRASWGTPEGGFLTDCSGAHAERMQCVREKCESIFGNHQDLREGCLWFVDWMKVADNPRFTFTSIQCPQELQGF